MSDQSLALSRHYALISEAKDHLGMLPEHLRGGLTRYLTFGMEPGRFLCAVLENDLAGAAGRCSEPTEERVEACLRSLVQFLYNYAPAACWGSREKRVEWQAETQALHATEHHGDTEPAPPPVPVVPDLEVSGG